MRKRIGSTRGITIVELLTTVTIIGVVASMAVPRFQIAVERLKFRSANRELVSTMHMARSLAITEKFEFGVQIYPERGVVLLYKKDTSSADYGYTSLDSLIKIDTLPSQIVLYTDIDDNAVIFRSNGSAAYSGGSSDGANFFAQLYEEHIIGFYTTNILAATGRIKSESRFITG